ncbi:hypothetical protein KKB99_03460, partial [bacterium]|nr:hypothetical protein [bacterium]MBU1025048.1 hypothetical protein [bacterium]
STVVPTSNTRRDEVERSVLRRMISGNRFLHYVPSRCSVTLVGMTFPLSRAFSTAPGHRRYKGYFSK